MTPRQVTHVYTNLIAGTAVLLAVYTGNPWAALVPCVLFVFVFFPRWRRQIARWIESLIALAGRMWKGSRDDRCDPQ